MKDADDDKTSDMLPTPGKRGRPPTGRARTPAQRKADQRARDKTRLLGAECEQDGNPVTVTGLIEAIARAARLHRSDEVEDLARELANRIRASSTDR